jgi:hypothetical protein
LHNRCCKKDSAARDALTPADVQRRSSVHDDLGRIIRGVQEDHRRVERIGESLSSCLWPSSHFRFSRYVAADCRPQKLRGFRSAPFGSSRPDCMCSFVAASPKAERYGPCRLGGMLAHRPIWQVGRWTRLKTDAEQTCRWPLRSSRNVRSKHFPVVVH